MVLNYLSPTVIIDGVVAGRTIAVGALFLSALLYGRSPARGPARPLIWPQGI